MAYIHVDARDFSDRELIEELESRDYTVLDPGERSASEEELELLSIYEALSRHQPNPSRDLIRDFIERKTGRILP